MINAITGDILTAKGIIIHQVNCRGVMGSGVAKAIREKWPTAFDAYRSHWERMGGASNADEMLGDVVFADVGDVWVGNCFAQDGYGKDGRRYTSYDALDRCMIEVARLAPKFAGASINFPLIGCGTGGAKWEVVKEIIEHRIPDSFVKNLWTLP